MSYISYVAAFVCLFAAGFLTTLFTLEIKSIYIQGIFWKMPLPVIYWGLAVLYAFTHSRLFKAGFKNSLARIIKPWLLAELAVLLVDLHVRLGASNPLNKVYMVYVIAVMLAVFALVGYLAACFAKDCFTKKSGLFDIGLIYLMTFIALSGILLKSGFVAGLLAMVGAFGASFVVDAGVTFGRAARTVSKFFEKRWKFLVFVYLLAVILRIMFGVILIIQTGERFTVASCDGLSYDENAQMIAKDFKSLFDGSLVFVVFGPYYWIFLGLIYKIFGRNFYAVSFIQSILASFMAPLVYYIMLKLTSQERMARLAAILTALCMSLVYLAAVLQPEALMIPLLYLYVLLLAGYSEKGKNIIGISALTGLVFGLMNGVRSIMVLFPVFAFIWLLFFVKSMGLRSKVVNFILFLAVTFIATYPAEYMYSKYRNADFTQDANTLVISQGVGTFRHHHSELDKLGFNPFASITGSIKALQEHPVEIPTIFLKKVAVNIHAFFFITFFGFFNPFILVLPSRYYNAFGSYMLSYIYIFIILGAFLWFSKKNRRDLVWLFFLIFVYYFISHPLFFTIRTGRHRAPLHPFFIMLFVIGFYYVWDCIKKWEKNRKIK
ncbi:MAG: glycosyltransferase family 39 protein [Candidatus Omnitrophica bacterium]|nr:glycosyltransferase family 39 protein [Candidatus Omnitrophota bacterium]